MARNPQPVDLGILLALAYGQFVRELRADLAERGFDDLGRSDGYVFRALDVAAMTTSDLAERLRISKQGAAQIVADMHARGYVERHPDPDDRRAQRLGLSSRGQAALAAAREFHEGYERRLKRAYGADQIRQLRDLLTAMASAGPGLNPDLRALYL
jgi:DNA-binding MarR family transcriptional regulator